MCRGFEISRDAGGAESVAADPDARSWASVRETGPIRARAHLAVRDNGLVDVRPLPDRARISPTFSTRTPTIPAWSRSVATN
jgi:hypothetical protein